MYLAGIALAIVGPFVIYEVFRRLPWPDRGKPPAIEVSTGEVHAKDIETVKMTVQVKKSP